MANDYHSRFKDCPWYTEEFPRITIGGVGGIGSWLAFFMGRIGTPMDLYDDDYVDFTNIGGQMYPINTIGQSKAQTVAQNIANFSGPGLTSIHGRYEGQKITDVVFTCFDNMAARRAMFEDWYSRNKYRRASRPAVFIDGRMTVESYQVYIVTPDKCKQYIETLFDDSMIEDLMCSMKATSHIGADIGSKMTQAFTNYMTNYNLQMDLRELPFMIRHETSMMYTSTE